MKKAVYYILLAVFIGVFLFAAYQIGSYMLEKHKSDEVLKDAGKYVYIPDLSSDEEPEGEPEQVYVDFAALEGVNSDIVAWLYGADTGLNYPIVQAEDNDYYLYRLLDGTWNKNGTILRQSLGLLRPEYAGLRPSHEVRRHVRRTGAV